VRETNRKNWEALKADPVAYQAYKAKKAARRASPEGRAKLREYQRKYQRQRRANAASIAADRGTMVDRADGRQD
jgi:adenylate kinase